MDRYSMVWHDVAVPVVVVSMDVMDKVVLANVRIQHYYNYNTLPIYLSSGCRTGFQRPGRPNRHLRLARAAARQSGDAGGLPA